MTHPQQAALDAWNDATLPYWDRRGARQGVHDLLWDECEELAAMTPEQRLAKARAAREELDQLSREGAGG